MCACEIDSFQISTLILPIDSLVFGTLLVTSSDSERQSCGLRVKIMSLGVYPTVTGGAEIHTYYQARRLVERGHGVTVLVESKKGVPRQGRIDGFTMISLGLPLPAIGLVSVILDGLVRLLSRKNETDVLHVQYCIYYSLSAYLFNILTSKPYVVSCRGSDVIWVRKNPFWKLVQRRVLKRAAFVTAVSDEIRRILELDYGIPREKIGIVPNGIDETEFQEVRVLRPKSDHDSVAFLGSLRPVKDPLTALRAFRLAHIAFPQFKLEIVGDGPLRTQLEKYVKDNNLVESVTITGSVNHKKALAALAKADFFLMSSVSEGFPNALLEAMSLGKTVIATAVGGVNDLVENGRSGLLVPAKSPEKLSEALVRVLADRELARRMGEAAQETSRDYTWDAVINRYLSIYDCILGSIGPLDDSAGQAQAGKLHLRALARVPSKRRTHSDARSC